MPAVVPTGMTHMSTDMLLVEVATLDSVSALVWSYCGARDAVWGLFAETAAHGCGFWELDWCKEKVLEWGLRVVCCSVCIL